MRNYLLLFGQRCIEKGAWFLAPFSLLFSFLSFARNRLYDLGYYSVFDSHKTVVSIGNIVAGGTGKTPFVRWLAQKLIDSGKKVAILSRGYGAIPDEALLLSKWLPLARVYVGKDRVLLAQKAAQDGADVILLDDGFQYRKLKRDFDLILLDGTDPLGKGHFIPWGYLRDHPSRLDRNEGSYKQIFQSGRDFVIQETGLQDGSGKNFTSFAGQKIASFSGIAKPKNFRKSVERLDGVIVSELILADHEPISLEKLEAFMKAAQKKGATWCVCTEKDFVKIKPGQATLLPLVFVKVELKWLDHSGAIENIIAKIEQKIDTVYSL